MITVDRERLADFDRAQELEWVVTNGLGGYASSTAIGMNTRRYHGLLVAAFNPPTERTVVLSRIEEEVRQAGQEWLLATTHYGRAVHPRGYLHAESFSLNPFPVTTFRFGGNVLKKSVALIHGENTVVVTYAFSEGAEPIDLALYPLIVHRDYHSLARAPFPAVRSIHIGQGIKLHFEGRTNALTLLSDVAAFTGKETVHHDLFLPKEAERGFDAFEDVYVPGRFAVTLRPGQSVSIFASTDLTSLSTDAKAILLAEAKRVNALLEKAPVADEFAGRLALAADTFLVRRASIDGLSVIAGYPWFTDWSRDTMISLPGLTLCVGRPREALEILNTFAGFQKGGLLPNRFPDFSRDPIEYNAIDAPLWFVNAVYQYWLYTGDRSGIERLLPACLEVIRAYEAGAEFGIRVGPDGLVAGGDPHTNLTWMDARIGEEPVTPRWGAPVEINALYHNALSVVAELKLAVGTDAREYASLARRTREAFVRAFVREDGAGLYDLIQDGRPDPAIRPNQIFAVSLPFSPLDRIQAGRVVSTVERHLLTDFGLRTLEPGHRHYQGRYRGGPRERDLAYHQGTVWPWLLGPFVTAFLRVQNYDPRAVERARKLLEPLHRHLGEAGLGTVSEIFDGDAPHRPDGCISQAWSVAELLRCYVEDIHGQRKKSPLA